MRPVKCSRHDAHHFQVESLKASVQPIILPFPCLMVMNACVRMALHLHLCLHLPDA
jgi:hypothetical protein